MEHTQEKKKKKWSILKWILLSFVILILAAIITVGIYAYSKFSKLGTDIESEKFEEEDIIINDLEEEVGVGYTNFVLFGADSRDNDVDSDLNTDSIIVVSLNNETKEIKLLSVYRDTLLDLTNGSIQKCNSAYRKGGAKQAINMLNMNLDLDIQKYVTVNFSIVSDVIDMLGGVEVDVSEAEMKAVNKYLQETANVAGKEAIFLTEAGVQTLDGVQATTYARIRKGVGNDYARAERQRELITLTLQKAVKADLATINKIIDVVFPQISTNFTLTDVLKYAKDLTKYQIAESNGFPFDKGDGTVSGKGSCVYPITLESNVQKLHEFLYGTINYQPTEKVISISQEIESLVTGSSNDSDSKDDDDSSSNGNDSSNEGNSSNDENFSNDDGNNSEGNISNNGNTSTENDSSNNGDTSTEENTSAEDNTSTEDDTSNEGDTSTEDNTSNENDTSTEDNTPNEEDTSAEGNTSTEGDATTENATSSENDTSTTVDSSSMENTTTEENPSAEDNISPEENTSTEE